MACQMIQLTDGTWVRVQLARGKKLTDKDRATLAEFAAFVRDRAIKRKELADAIERRRTRADV